MKKEVIILNYTLRCEIDVDMLHILNCGDVKDAMAKGAINLITSNVDISTESGMVCEDEDVLENTKQAIEYGLIEKG